MLSHLMVMDFDTYIKWRFGKLKRKPVSRGEYKPHTDNSTSKSIPSHNSKQIDKNFIVNQMMITKEKSSSQYVIGQAYNKSGLQVLTKKETLDPNTGKTR